jgi:hypothetical protein
MSNQISKWILRRLRSLLLDLLLNQPLSIELIPSIMKQIKRKIQITIVGHHELLQWCPFIKDVAAICFIISVNIVGFILNWKTNAWYDLLMYSKLYWLFRNKRSFELHRAGIGSPVGCQTSVALLLSFSILCCGILAYMFVNCVTLSCIHAFYFHQHI